MEKTRFNLEKDIESIRKEFPVLERCIYLISNSLGAVPKQVSKDLDKYYSLWAEEGVDSWKIEWWDFSRYIGNKVAFLLGAGEDEVTMMTNATLCHWVALSTLFNSKDKKRDTIVMTDLDFSSVLYAVAQISKFTGWKVDIVKSNGKPGIDVENILKRIDEKTLCVAVSHVYFKSAYIQDIAQIAVRSRQMGVLSLIDGYHAPGVIPVDVKNLDVDFYIGGCLKWLCGGPGNAFLYVKPELADNFQPQLTGWLAHKSPFLFSQEMKYTKGAYKFMSGTPPVPCLYTAGAGLDIIRKIGISGIRKKSLILTGLIQKKAKERGFRLFTPEEKEIRGGAVSLGVPHAFQVKQALEKRRIKIDFRKSKGDEPDVIRVGPHFYSTHEEVDVLFNEIDTIYTSGEFKQFSDEPHHVT